MTQTSSEALRRRASHLSAKPPSTWAGSDRCTRTAQAPTGWPQTAPCGTPDGRSGEPADRAILTNWGFSGCGGREGCETGFTRAIGRSLWPTYEQVCQTAACSTRANGGLAERPRFRSRFWRALRRRGKHAERPPEASSTYPDTPSENELAAPGHAAESELNASRRLAERRGA